VLTSAFTKPLLSHSPHVLHEQVLQVDGVCCEQVATMVADLVEKATATEEWQFKFKNYYCLTSNELKEHLKITCKEMGAHFLKTSCNDALCDCNSCNELFGYLEHIIYPNLQLASK
jgi:hypothetical protein